MTQHNHNLSLNQQGKDVALLQSRLITIGYVIALAEVLGEHFGESMQQALLHFRMTISHYAKDICCLEVT